MRLPEVVIRIDRKSLVLVTAFVLVGASAGVLWSETLTIATTYPSPSGIYNFLVTTGNAAATAADTVLNRNAGNTILVPATNAGGKVGVGMTPVNKLDVAGGIGATGVVTAAAAVFSGSVKLGDDASACTAAKEGALRWRSGQLDGCRSLVWTKLSVDPPPFMPWAGRTFVKSCSGWPAQARITFAVANDGTASLTSHHFCGTSAGFQYSAGNRGPESTKLEPVLGISGSLNCPAGYGWPINVTAQVLATGAYTLHVDYNGVGPADCPGTL